MQANSTKSPPKTRGKRPELARWLERVKPSTITERDWDELRTLLAPISESNLRHLLRDTGIPLAALVEGVRQETLDTLEGSLLRLLDEYEAGDRGRRVLVRRLVITAKDHARWASRNEQKRAEKQEMILWVTTWLENPPLFRDWVRLRRAAAAL
ncbi:MAG: hypothetical protein JO307_18700 [Bryobacterales bacterium]|nr:hypothetical protein [Bryobacterales bacterium]MBV9398879.1 hypothetical protein [Bryobacterales bacterium]